MPKKPRFGSIYRRGRLWWISFYVNGRKVRESSKSDRYSDAERLLRKRLQEVDTGVYAGPLAERTTVSELLDNLLTDFDLNGKSIGWARIVDAHLRPFFGHLRAGTVGTSYIQSYVLSRKQAGRSNATINRELGWLRRAFNLGLQASPPKVKRGLPRIPRLEEAPPRKGFFEHNDFLALRAELPAHLRPVITFGYYTGCRKGEIIRLRWQQVDLAQRLVRLEPGETKNDEPRTIPLLGEIYEMLVLQKQIRDQKWPRCPWVFFRYGKQIRSFDHAWHEACKRAGLWQGEAETGRKTRLFHDLRRTGVRNLVRAGVPERVAMLISGHKTRSVFERYNVVSERDLHEAAARLEHHFAEIEKGSHGHNLGTIHSARSEGGGETVPKRDRKLLN